jgi:SAM-dependent methyltransferase
MIQPASLDAAVATDFLEHLPRDAVPDALRVIRRSLKAGGVFIGRVPNAVSPFAGAIRHGDFTHQSWYTPSSIRQLTKVAGFTSVEVRACDPLIHGIPSALRWVAWKGVSALVKIAFAIETGSRRGVVVTQNMTFVAHTDQG